MKKIFMIAIAACAMLAASCTTDNLGEEINGAYKLDATVENYGAGSRAGFDLNNDGAFFWHGGDAIAVGSGSLTKFTTDCTDGETTATFTGYSPASGYAIYPYSGAQGISGTTLTYNFANTYNYDAVDTDFFAATSAQTPMWATVAGNTVAFKHLGGIFAFKFPNLKAGQNQTFTLVADKKIAGTFTADLSAAEPVFEATASDVAAEKTVTINFSLDADADAVFYVPVPVGTYELDITLTNGSDTFTTGYKNLAVARRDIRYTTLTSHSLQGSEAKVVASPAGVNEAMKESESVVVEDVTSAVPNTTVTVEIPRKPEAQAAQPHSLAFNDIDENTETIEVIEDTNAGTSVSELVISVPSLAAAKKLVVDMPNTTVTIAINGMGTMTYAEVLATTAENTLVVESGITIESLKVVAGNVLVKAGATIEAIARTAENTDEVTYLYYETGANIPASLGAQIVAVNTLAFDLHTVAAEGGSVVLTEDVTLDKPLNVTSTMVLDLGGHTLSFSDAVLGTSMITNNGTLTIENGTVAYDYAGANDGAYTKGNYTINNYGSLLLDNVEVTIEASTVEAGVKFAHALYAVHNAGKFVMDGSESHIYNANGYAMRMWAGNNCDVTIEDGHIEGSRAIWLQLPGSATADAPKAKLTVNGGTLEGTGEGDYKLAFYAYSYGNNMGNVDIEINGGQIIGDVALTGGANKTSIEKLTINGGTFAGLYGDVYSYGDDAAAAEAITIKGGKFSDIYPIYYLDSADEVLTLNNDVELAESLVFTGEGTLDLGGYTISQEQAQSAAYNMIQNRGTLTIKNGTLDYADTAELTADVNYVSNTIQNSGSLTLEDVTVLNNSTESVADYGYPHPIDNSGKLVINSGEFTNNANYSSMRVWCTTDTDTEVTINGGTFNGSIDVHNVSAAANKGTLTITDGTFNANNEKNIAVRLLGFGVDVDEMNGYIKGGTFNGQLKLNNYVGGEFNSQVFFVSGGKFSVDPTDFYAAGYGAAKEGDYYVVQEGISSEAGLVAAIAAAKAGDTIELIGDVVVNATITVASDKEFTLDLKGHNLSYAVDNNGAASTIFNNKGNMRIVNSAAEESVITFVASDPDLQAVPAYVTNTITNEATLYIGKGVTVINESDGGASYAVDDKGKFVLDGGTLSAKRCALRIAKYNQDDVWFTMNAGSTVKGSTPAWIQLPSSNSAVAPKITVVINGGLMQSTKANPDEADVLYTYSYGNSHANTSITINGGEFLGGTVSIGAGYKGDAANLTINGGTFDHDVVQWLENNEYKVLFEANK